MFAGFGLLWFFWKFNYLDVLLESCSHLNLLIYTRSKNRIDIFIYLVTCSFQSFEIYRPSLISTSCLSIRWMIPQRYRIMMHWILWKICSNSILHPAHWHNTGYVAVEVYYPLRNSLFAWHSLYNTHPMKMLIKMVIFTLGLSPATRNKIWMMLGI